MVWSHLLLLNPLFLFATSSQHQDIYILRTKIPYPKTIPVLIIKWPDRLVGWQEGAFCTLLQTKSS
jgi:hypothetical protein